MEQPIIKKTPIEESYIISKKVLGFGAHGSVFQIVDRDTGTNMALKVLLDSEEAWREVEIYWRLKDCPEIVKLIDIYYNKHRRRNYYLIVMECMVFGTLIDRIHDDSRGKLTERTAAEIMHQICKAVKYMHDRNIAHRDIKPQNILYTTGYGGILKLADFGFAVESNCSRDLSYACYTLHFVAPEILGPSRYDKSCDIWSLGVLMFIMICGYPPFRAKCRDVVKNRIRSGIFRFPSFEWKDISPEAKSLIKSMLELKVKDRLTIDQVLDNPWVSRCARVPLVALRTRFNWRLSDRRLTDKEDNESPRMYELTKIRFKDLDLKKHVVDAKSVEMIY